MTRDELLARLDAGAWRLRQGDLRAAEELRALAAEADTLAPGLDVADRRLLARTLASTCRVLAETCQSAAERLHELQRGRRAAGAYLRTSLHGVDLALLLAPTLAAPVGLSVGATLVGEATQDRAITEVYGGTSLSGEASAALLLPRGLEVKLSVGYRRLSGREVDTAGAPSEASTWLWYAPVALTVGGAARVGSLTVSGGLGPAVVPWAEAPGADAAIGYAGGKYGALAELGLRAPLPGVRPSLHAPDQGPRGADLVATLGYRATLPRHEGCPAEDPCGLGFSALRLGLGVAARF